MLSFPFAESALKVTQPIGTFYITVLPAELLLDTCFSDQLSAVRASGVGYELEGTQRGVTVERLRTIADYIDRYDSSFPNSVILAANLKEEDGNIEEDQKSRWYITENKDCDSYTLMIPSSRKLAAIIDGQHRLFAFRFADSSRLSVQLICSIFVDLPKPFQAQLFATINSTQKPVDKSLTYELFGYNIAEEPERYWSPDKLAVFLARKLNVEDGSPFKGKITIAPLNDFAVETSSGSPPWKISMATVVEGILRLVSSNPKRDTNRLLTPRPNERSVLQRMIPQDRSVLRSEYLESNDQLIYLIVRNFLEASHKAFWEHVPSESFITKTVGVQALFDVLRKLVPKALAKKDVSVKYFFSELSRASGIDFADERFRNASGSGRTEIRRAIENALGLG
jgi:DNA phosphorothioation-associated DGQHR protein 1